MARQICTDSDFVTAWQASNNVKEVADATGLSVNTCQTRAANLRKALTEAGLPTLKRMAKGRAKTKKDLEALANLIQPAVDEGEEETANTEMEAE
jgi:hypothetical protein